MTVRIVTDSSGDLPLALAAEMGITVVPAIVRFGEEPFLDGVEIDHDTFYRRLQEERVFPTTSQPSPGQFAEAYDRLAPEADAIVSLHLSSRLSGTFNSAVQGAKASGAACPVEVVDSRSTSLGLGLIALEAARLARSGASLEAVLAATRGWIPGSRLTAALDTLEFLAKGGRIGKARALLGGLLGIKPILGMVDGEVAPVDRVRGGRAAHPRILEILHKRVDRQRPVIAGIGHANAPVWADRLRALVRDQFQVAELIQTEVGPVVGANVGPGVVGVCLFQPREEEMGWISG